MRAVKKISRWNGSTAISADIYRAEQCAQKWPDTTEPDLLLNHLGIHIDCYGVTHFFPSIYPAGFGVWPLTPTWSYTYQSQLSSKPYKISRTTRALKFSEAKEKSYDSDPLKHSRDARNILTKMKSSELLCLYYWAVSMKMTRCDNFCLAIWAKWKWPLYKFKNYHVWSADCCIIANLLRSICVRLMRTKIGTVDAQ